MPTNEETLLELLKANGPMGNGKAREQLGWTAPQYEIVKASLMAQGLVATGRGRGGSLKLAEPNGQEADEPTAKEAKKPNAAEPKSQETQKPEATQRQTAMDEQAFLSALDKKLWTAADRLRSSLDAAVYKHAVLGLIFLKYVSDSFEMRQQEVLAQLEDKKSDYYLDPADYKKAGEYEAALTAELEERDYYTAQNVFWVSGLLRRRTSRITICCAMLCG